jgi:hypothetical protein
LVHFLHLVQETFVFRVIGRREIPNIEAEPVIYAFIL